MRFDGRFLKTEETENFLNTHQLKDHFKELSNGVFELRAQAQGKLHQLLDALDEKSPLLQIEEKVLDLARSYLEKIEGGNLIQPNVSVQDLWNKAGLNIQVTLKTRGPSVRRDLVLECENNSPEKSEKLQKYFPLARLLMDKDSPLYSQEAFKKAKNFSEGEQVLTLLKRNADLKKLVREAIKEVFDKFDPKQYSEVDLILDAEKEIQGYLKRFINVEKPQFSIKRYQITEERHKGSQSVIEFSASGKTARYVISVLKGHHSFQLFTVLLDGKSYGKELGFFEEKWLVRNFPGRSEEELKEILTRWGFRVAKTRAEKNFNLISTSMSGFKVEAKADKTIAEYSFYKELSYPGRADELTMTKERKKEVTDILSDIAKIAKKSKLQLSLGITYSEMDYYDGCDTYMVPSFYLSKDYKVSVHERDHHSTPKGWQLDLDCAIEFTDKSKLNFLSDIRSLLSSLERIALNPMDYQRSRW